LGYNISEEGPYGTSSSLIKRRGRENMTFNNNEGIGGFENGAYNSRAILIGRDNLDIYYPQRFPSLNAFLLKDFLTLWRT
jgi:hypothetical protein